MIVSTGKPTGVLRTARQYENFIMELEWRHMKSGGNAGLFDWSDALPAVGVPFTRSFEIQILDGQNSPNYTSHGDVFGIWGATMTPDRPHPAGWMRCLPSENRAKPSPEWNHYRVTCQNGAIKLAVNGKEVSGREFLHACARGTSAWNRRARNVTSAISASGNCRPAVRARPRRRLSTKASPRSTRAWTCAAGSPTRAIRDTGEPRIRSSTMTARAPPRKRTCWTEKDYGDFVMIADWRLPGKPAPAACAVVLPKGDDARNPDGSAKTLEIPYAGDSGILLRGRGKDQVNITCNTIGSGELYGYRTDKKMPAEVGSARSPESRPTARWASGIGS